MNFTFSEEQLQLQDSARRFCAGHAPAAAVRAWMEHPRGYDDAVWRDMLAMGWGGIAVPEQYGGLGLGRVEMAIVQQELGRTLLPSPYLPCIALAATAILCFLYSWNDFFFALILTRTEAMTAPVAVVNFMNYEGWEWGKIAAGGTMVMLPVLVFSIAVRKFLIQGMTAGAVKG